MTDAERRDEGSDTELLFRLLSFERDLAVDAYRAFLASRPTAVCFATDVALSIPRWPHCVSPRFRQNCPFVRFRERDQSGRRDDWYHPQLARVIALKSDDRGQHGSRPLRRAPRWRLRLLSEAAIVTRSRSRRRLVFVLEVSKALSHYFFQSTNVEYSSRDYPRLLIRSVAL